MKNIWKNEGEMGAWTPQNKAQAEAAPGCANKSCNKIDDDVDGLVDDYIGWNWGVQDVPNKPLIGNNIPRDRVGHGTHVSGIIGAAHNKIGVTGINNKVQLMAVRFLDQNGSGTLEGAVNAIEYAIEHKADVINASWGGPGNSKIIGKAVEKATKAGILFVVAAGNSNEDNDNLSRYPTNYNYPGVLSVIATDALDNRAFFSSFGKNSTHVAAPGFNIYSTYKGSGYIHMSGTSMATPHVTGLAAMLMGYHKELRGDPEAVKKIIMQSSDVNAVLMGKCSSGGRINILNAIRKIVTNSHKQPEAQAQWTEMIPAYKESTHPYSNKAEELFVIRQPGAKWMKLKFGRYSLENESDQIEIYNSAGELFDVITGYGLETTSKAIPGDEVKLILRTDSTVTSWGYELLGYQYVN